MKYIIHVFQVIAFNGFNISQEDLLSPVFRLCNLCFSFCTNGGKISSRSTFLYAILAFKVPRSSDSIPTDNVIGYSSVCGIVVLLTFVLVGVPGSFDVIVALNMEPIVASAGAS